MDSWTKSESVKVKILWNSINEDTLSAHLRSLRESGAHTCPCRQLVSLQGFSLNTEWLSPPSPPNLPISPRARYGESDDDVLEQLLQGRFRQEKGAKPPPPANVLKESKTRSHIRHRLSGACAVISCVTRTLHRPFSNNQKWEKNGSSHILWH